MYPITILPMFPLYGMINTIFSITFITSLVSALWLVYKFVIMREGYPKVSFDIEAELIHDTKKNKIVEFRAIIHNKGFVRLKLNIEDFTLKIRYLTNENLGELKNSFDYKDQKKNQKVFNALYFPNKLLPEDRDSKAFHWMKKEDEYLFVDAGITQIISLPLFLPGEAVIVQIHSVFKYSDKESDFHSIQKLIKF